MEPSSSFWLQLAASSLTFSSFLHVEKHIDSLTYLFMCACMFSSMEIISLLLYPFAASSLCSLYQNKIKKRRMKRETKKLDEGNKLRLEEEESLRYGTRQDHKALNIAEEAAKRAKKRKTFFISFSLFSFPFSILRHSLQSLIL